MNFSNLFSYPILIDQLSLDIEQIKNFCYKRKEIDPGRIKSNQHGWQSQDLERGILELNELISEIEKLSQEYTKFLQIKDTYHPYISEIWININQKNSYNNIHSHHGALISGVFYVTGESNSGNIVFTNPCDISMPPEYVSTFNQYNGLNYYENPSPGKIMLFPSYIKHYVDLNTTDNDRISISFNLVLSEKMP